MTNKITNCARCGKNPWKQGCFALWGKSPKDLLYDKENDTGYICSVCSIGTARGSRTLRETIRILDGENSNQGSLFAEKYKQCPIYGKKEND